MNDAVLAMLFLMQCTALLLVPANLFLSVRWAIHRRKRGTHRMAVCWAVAMALFAVAYGATAWFVLPTAAAGGAPELGLVEALAAPVVLGLLNVIPVGCVALLTSGGWKQRPEDPLASLEELQRAEEARRSGTEAPPAAKRSADVPGWRVRSADRLTWHAYIPSLVLGCVSVACMQIGVAGLYAGRPHFIFIPFALAFGVASFAARPSQPMPRKVRRLPETHRAALGRSGFSAE